MQTNEIKISYFKHPIYKEYAADEDGNIYYENTLGTVQSMDGFKMEFPITKSMINKKFFANVSINGVKYSSEIVVDSDNYVNNNIKNIQ